MKKFGYFQVIVAVLLAASSCGPKQQHTGNKLAETDTIPVTIMPLASHDTAQAIVATGTFTTDDETVLGFKSGGIIQRLTVKEGESFRKGQLLATVETTEINTAVRQSALAVEKAGRDYQRAQSLYRDSVATLEQLENAQTALEAAREDAQRANYNLGHTSIRAAFDGYVLQRPASAGQVVGPGTPVLVVSGTGRAGWLLRVGVSDRQWAAIQPGDGATVTTDAAAGQLIPATVHRKSEGVDPQSGTFTVYLKLGGSSLPPLASGMFGKAEIRLSSRSDVWIIPYEALLDGDANTGYVFVTNDRKTAQRVQVQVAELQKDHIVVSGGLEQAGALIVSGSPYLRDGSNITVK